MFDVELLKNEVNRQKLQPLQKCIRRSHTTNKKMKEMLASRLVIHKILDFYIPTFDFYTVLNRLFAGNKQWINNKCVAMIFFFLL